MILEHLRLRRRLGLLALGVLEGTEREGVSTHVAACARCRRELGKIQAVLGRLEEDPLRRVAEPALSCEALLSRVQARLEENGARPKASAGWRLAGLPVAAGVLIGTGWLLRLSLNTMERTPRAPASEPASQGVMEPSVPDEVISRMERRLAREQTARYLNEAQDVLMTMATLHRHCADESLAVDVQDDVQRSRQLLLRRILVVDAQSREAPMAEPLLADVEDLLRQVADLPSCARPSDLRAIHQRMTAGRVLMKIDLLARELQG